MSAEEPGNLNPPEDTNPAAPVAPHITYCENCGTTLHRDSPLCPNCELNAARAAEHHREVRRAWILFVCSAIACFLLAFDAKEESFFLLAIIPPLFATYAIYKWSVTPGESTPAKRLWFFILCLAVILPMAVFLWLLTICTVSDYSFIKGR